MSENPPSGDLPPEVVVDMLTVGESLTGSVRAFIEPVRQQRRALRKHFHEQGWIDEIPPPTRDGPYHLGAVDGAHVINSLAAGDHVGTLAVSVASGLTAAGTAPGRDYRHWSDFRPHSADQAALAKAVMMMQETMLLSGMPHPVRLFDGSHATPVVALLVALASPDEQVRERVIELAQRWDAVAALNHLACSETVIGCPKADTSTELVHYCRRQLDTNLPAMPDKVLAALVLDPGEILVTEHATPSWPQLRTYIHRVEEPHAKDLAGRIDNAIRPLHDPQLQVVHVKPQSASTVLRVEAKATLDPWTLRDYVTAVLADCTPPFLQEPACQHLADRYAKSLSVGMAAQIDRIRLDLADTGDDGALEYVLRRYRTET